AAGREARVPHRRRGRLRELARRVVADLAGRRRRIGTARDERRGVGRHDPEARVVRLGAAQRRAPRPPPRRPAPAPTAPRVLHPGGRRNHGVPGERRMTAFEALQRLDAENVMQTYGRLPVAFVRGEGTKLWDSEGNEYLDFLTGLAVTSLGHAHPDVAAAI